MSSIWVRTSSGSDALVDSGYAWRRLLVSLLLATIGGIGLWSSVVVLPAIQTEFGVSRDRIRQIEVRALEKVQKAVQKAAQAAQPEPEPVD